MSSPPSKRCPMEKSRFKALFFVLFLVQSIPTQGDDFYWTNLVSGNFTNGANWFTNGLVVNAPPQSTDNVHFTNDVTALVSWSVNRTNANAYYSATLGTMTQSIGSVSWLLTNTYSVGHLVNSTSAVVASSGTLYVTNGNGNATLVVGETGNGTLTMRGGTLVVDNLLVTNNGASFTNSTFNPNYGTLTIKNGATVVQSNSFLLGTVSFQNVALTFLGGTSYFETPGHVVLGANSENNNTLRIVVSGPNTVWTNAFDILIGTNVSDGSGSSMFITNGAKVYDRNGRMGLTFSSSHTTVVAGAQSLWFNRGQLTVGSQGGANKLLITNGGQVVAIGNTLIGVGGAGNEIIVTDPGSIFSNTASLLVGTNSGGTGSSSSRFSVTNGALAFGQDILVGSQGGGGASARNVVSVYGTGSIWRNTGLLKLGTSSSTNQLFVQGGGYLENTTGYVGFTTTASNWAYVADSGSIWSNAFDLIVGDNGRDNILQISNGGTVYAVNVKVGNSGRGAGTILLNGTNSLLQLSGMLDVGTNNVTLGTGTVVIAQGAILESTGMISGLAGTGVITNDNGIFQFTTASPVITTNTLNSIILTNGTVSYRNVSAADIFNTQISNITFQGNNTFLLNFSTNTPTPSYTFGTNTGGLYQHLTLFNGSTRWQSTSFTMGSGGILSISNTVATVSGVFTNQGTVNVFNSRVTYEGPVTLDSAYLSDPSTNIFTTNVLITPSGYIQATAGDLYQFERNLSIQSTQSNLFNMSGATVLFTNFGGPHFLDLTGSSALDRGTNGIVTLSDVTNNFAFGTLILAGAGDTLRVTGAVNNALYVGALDLGALANTNNLFTDINVYYDANLAANAYLGRSVYDLVGNGMLIPYGVPEPATLLILGAGLAGVLFKRRR